MDVSFNVKKAKTRSLEISLWTRTSLADLDLFLARLKTFHPTLILASSSVSETSSQNSSEEISVCPSPYSGPFLRKNIVTSSDFRILLCRRDFMPSHRHQSKSREQEI